MTSDPGKPPSVREALGIALDWIETAHDCFVEATEDHPDANMSHTQYWLNAMMRFHADTIAALSAPDDTERMLAEADAVIAFDRDRGERKADMQHWRHVTQALDRHRARQAKAEPQT